MPDIERFRNMTLQRIETPSFWHLEYMEKEECQTLAGKKSCNKYVPNHVLSRVAKDFIDKRETNVIFLRLKRRQSDIFGQKPHGPNVYEISEIFTKFGDINIVKKTPFSCYVEMQDFDKRAVEDAYRSSKVQLLSITASGKRSAARTAKGKQS